MAANKKSSGDIADVAAALSRAIPARDKLAKAADKFNAAIIRTEQALAALKLGVRGSVEISEDPDGSFVNLVWGKYNGEWHLLIEEGRRDRPDEEYESLLTSAPRWVRQNAIRHLDELAIQLTKTIDGEIKRVEESTVEIENFAERIETWRQQNLAADKVGGVKEG
jgi:hypothetical protein